MILTWYSPVGTAIVFSKDSDTYRLLRGYSGFGNPPVTHPTSQAPGQDGKTRGDSYFEPREISFDVMMTAPTLSDLKWAGRVLSLSLNPLQGAGTLVITDDDGSEYSITCIANSTPTTSSLTGRGGTFQLVAVNLIALDDPFFYTHPGHIVPWFAGTPLVFPYTLPYVFPTNTPTQTLVNAGNVETGAKIVLTGAIVNPTITRTYTDAFGAVTSEAFSFTLTMTAGEILTITTAFGNKTITLKHDDGNYDANPFQYLNATPEFWQLVPGNNEVTLTHVSMDAATTMVVEYSDRFSAIYV
jgi:hypothetical protein